MEEGMTNGFHFPPITVNRGNVLSQAAKVAEEAGECITAAANLHNQPDSATCLTALCEEAWDVLQAAETLVRQLKRQAPAYMAAAKYTVYSRCYERGYYEEVV